MPRRKPYPLEPLARLRDAAVDESKAEVAERVRGSLDAERARRAADSAVDEHASSTQAEVERETGRAEAGDANVEDLRRLGAWQVVRTQDVNALRAKADDAAEAAESAQADLGRAQEALLAARVDAELVVQHRERFDQKEEHAREAREEEEALEVHTVRWLKEKR